MRINTSIRIRPTSLVVILFLLVGLNTQAQDIIEPVSTIQSKTTMSSLESAYNHLRTKLFDESVDHVTIYALSDEMQGSITVENWKTKLYIGDGPGWLFFIDDVPLANWEHPCRYVLVKKTGDIVVVKGTTPPKNIASFVKMSQAKAIQAKAIQESEKSQLNNARVSSESDIINKTVRLGASATPASKRWAVIISGGYDKNNNHPRYYNDSQFFYRTLLANGFDKNNIFVLIADGDDPAVDQSDGSSSNPDLDGDGSNDIGYNATVDSIETVFEELSKSLDNDDLLYIFVTDHGGSDDSQPFDDPTAYLWLWGERITDSDFAIQVNKVTTLATVAIFEECFSGGMIDNLEGNNRVLMSASRFWELSYAKNSSYDEFSYYATYALKNPTAIGVDANTDGTVSMEEAYLYALSKDSWQSESLAANGSNSGEHPSYYSNPWDLGRKISLGGLAATVASPIYFGITQKQISLPYPSGGIFQTITSGTEDNGYFKYDLPFSFPYGNNTYGSIYVHTNGMIFFAPPSGDYTANTVDAFSAVRAIAPLWDDLTVNSSDSDGIYTKDETYSTVIRWKAHTNADSKPVNMAVQLYADGTIHFLYGSGNNHIARIEGRDKTIGVSMGNGDANLALRNGKANLSQVNGLEFKPVNKSSKKVLYFSDHNLGDNPFPTALFQLKLNFDTVTSYGDFESKVNSNGYDLVICLLQNYYPGGTRPSSLPNFYNYLKSGGKAIIADWYQQGTLDDYLGIEFLDPDSGSGCSVGCNEAKITVNANFLKNAIGNSLDIEDPGWNVFSYSMKTTSAKKAATYTNSGYTAIAYTSNTIVNGPLKDTFSNYEIGLKLAKAEINQLIGKKNFLPSIYYLLLY